MPSPLSEIKLIEMFGKTRVIGVAINHEDMTKAEVLATTVRYEAELGIPATDALWHEPAELVAMVTAAFPALKACKQLATA